MRRQRHAPTIIGLLAFFLLCLVPAGNAQSPPCVQITPNQSAFQLGEKCNFTSASGPVGGFSVSGLTFWQVIFVPSGTVTGATLSLDSSATGISGSWSTGGVIAAATIGAMTSAGSYANTTATSPTNFMQLTPTITGSGIVTVIIFGYTNNPAGGGTSGGSVTVSNFPSTQNTNIQQMGGVALSLFATLFSAQSATATATSGAVRIPDFAGTGTLEISGASIAGSPSGCQIALAYQPNTGAPASAAQATITFTPGNSTQLFAVNPTNPTGDAWIATYTCGTYPSAGTISVAFAPSTPASIVGALPAGANTVGKVDLLGNAGAAVDAAAGATAAANSVAAGGTYNASAPTPSTGQQEPLQLDSSANLKVNVSAALPAGANTIGAVNTQPTGFGTLIGFQQAVTASAVALSSNAAHSFCVTALPANTINIYVGPSGVTTSTGFPLQPGQTACWSLSNTNLVYVIAASTGASVAVTGT